jgi:hypothetical protein
VYTYGLPGSKLRVIQAGAQLLGKSEQVSSGTLRRATSSRKTIVATPVRQGDSYPWPRSRLRPIFLHGNRI